jgi:hypothetical protein
MNKSVAICIIASGLILCPAIYAASPQMKPVLKSIDPSQAKTDTVPPPLPPPSPNPLGRITGAPISPPLRRSVSPLPINPNLPPPSPPPAALNRQPSYPSAYPAEPTNGYPSVYQAAPPSTRYPAAPAPSSATNAFPSEDLLPEFGKALPFDKLPNYQPAPSNYGQGFSTEAPARDNFPLSYPQPVSIEEQRVVRLEQAAFGSTYPEHEVPDRIDHLEKEVFGQTSDGNLGIRLSKLEAKLSGQGAFTQ